MFLSDMDAQQRGALNSFVTVLGGAGWQLESLNAALEAGISMSPEAMASHVGACALIDAALLLDAGEFSLSIADSGGQRRIRFAFSLGPEFRKLLESLVSAQDTLSRDDFASFLMFAAPFSGKIWFIDHEMARFALEMPCNENSTEDKE